jgi:hypothetical protein
LIKEKTAKIRKSLSLFLLKLLTPKFSKEVLDCSTYINRVPRPFTLFLKKKFGTKSIKGAEIGFGLGDNAKSLLEELNIENLYCIDPFILKHRWTYHKGKIIKNRETDPSKSFYWNLKLDNRVIFIEKPSEKAFSKLPHDLDFVYIDGNHEPEVVIQDILDSFNHTKAGGFVGGHDFCREAQKLVVKAIFEFCAKYGCVPTIEMPDFWFKK